MSANKCRITIILGIGFIALLGIHECINQVKDFILDTVKVICEFAEYGNIISIEGSGDGLLTNVFGHSITFISVGKILQLFFPKFKEIKFIGKVLYFFISEIVNNIVNLINNITFK